MIIIPRCTRRREEIIHVIHGKITTGLLQDSGDAFDVRCKNRILAFWKQYLILCFLFYFINTHIVAAISETTNNNFWVPVLIGTYAGRQHSRDCHCKFLFVVLLYKKYFVVNAFFLSV